MQHARNGGIRKLALGMLCLIIVASMETFNPGLTGLTDDALVQQGGDIMQQLIAIALWTGVIFLSFIPGVSRSPTSTHGMLWPVVLLAWVVVSPVWSTDPTGGGPKALVFLLSSLAAWRLAFVITAEEMFACLFYTLGTLLLLSLLLVIFYPSVGLLVHDWQHEGQWKGVFGTKQGLGILSAIFLLLSLLRLSHRRSLFNLAAAALGLACMLGAESRGAGIIAVVAASCLFLARGRPRIASLVPLILLVDLGLGIAEITYFVVTGNASFLVFGYDINLTERTFIWQYALRFWVDQPYLGTGLNGFWTAPGITSGFVRMHGWVLDNYHSGYLGMITEIGAVGLLLFCVVTAQLVAKLRVLLAHTRTVGNTPDRLSLEMTLGIIVMFFTINLSETYFLRSTNFFALLFSFLLVKVLSKPYPAYRRAPARGYRQPSGLGLPAGTS